MDIFVLASVAILAVMAGYWAGRSVQWQMAEGVPEAGEEGARPSGSRERNTAQKRIILGQVIGSPVTGVLNSLSEEGRVMVRISSAQGKVFAPASGRITRLYPMGRAMKLRTESGTELMIQVGDETDEMYSSHYRCRVMEHEVVRKGKLLLEYDTAGLLADGACTDVTMSVENREAGQVSVAANTHIRAGEEVMRVRGSMAAQWED